VFTNAQWETLQRLANAATAAAAPGYGMGAAAAPAAVPLRITVTAAPVAVYLDGQEWRGMARVEAVTAVNEWSTAAQQEMAYGS
jgi:hypothetical protein